MQIEAVFFDAGNTLIRPDPPVGEVYARALARAGIEAGADQVQQEFERCWRRLRQQRAPGGLEYGSTESEAKDWWRRVVRESLSAFGPPSDLEGLFLELWNHFASGAAWRVYDDVLPTFEGLRQRGKGIGLISNWDVRLTRLMDQLGLAAHLRWSVMSWEVAAEKPDAAIFRRALAMCALPAEQVLHVGDSYEEDVVGALGAGLHAVWLRRDAPGPDPSARVPVVRDLTELLRLVR